MNTSKILFYLGVFVLGIGTINAQYEVYAFGNPEMNVLYRGYNNKLKIALGEDCANCQIIPFNMIISKSDELYIAKPGSQRTAELLFVDSLTKDTVKTLSFKVHNLPDPQIYWGGKVSGTKANTNSSLVQCKYGPSVPLVVNFEVIRVQLSADYINETITCEGERLSDSFLKAVRSIPKDKIICLICDVKGPDGMVRKVAGCYKR